MKLEQLGRKYGTDKADHGYLPIYAKHLPDLAVTSILEIGVLNGSSLRMWRDYFPDAQVYGVDIDPDCRKHAGDRIDITIGSQDDVQMLTALAERAGGFDVVIDDGSHVNALTVASFDILWPHTRGIYVIEDLDTSYQDLTAHVGVWPGMEHNQGLDYRNDRLVIEVMFLRAIRGVDAGRGEAHFYRNLAVFVR